ncbi:MAG: hypothetical protein JWN07_1281 [Hyphomicrobiales bacterium]|nr:hypothetical protein [Hyphomicrobiales bacterium]
MLVHSAPSAALPICGMSQFDARADGALRRVSVAGGRVLIDRQVEGIAMRLGLPCSAYRGVVLTLAGAPEAPRFIISLEHADPELSVTLAETPDDDDIVALWRHYAAQMGLPRFLQREPGMLEAAEQKIGQVAVGPAPVMRRRGAVALRRRPRFLTRRRMGERRLMKIVSCEQVLSAPC